MMPRALVAGALLLGSALAPHRQLQGQSAAQRIAGVTNGTVRFTVALRPDVCGSGQNIWTRGDRRTRTTSGDRTARDVEYDVDCDSGPGRVVLEKAGGEVRDLRFYVGGRWRAGSTVTDLGAVSAKDAAQLLLAVARSNNGKPCPRGDLPADPARQRRGVA